MNKPDGFTDSERTYFTEQEKLQRLHLRDMHKLQIRYLKAVRDTIELGKVVKAIRDQDFDEGGFTKNPAPMDRRKKSEGHVISQRTYYGG